MYRVIERWGGVRNHGQGQGMVGRPTGSCTGAESGRKAYGVMGRVKEWWGGIHGHGQGQGAVGRRTGSWALMNCTEYIKSFLNRK